MVKSITKTSCKISIGIDISIFLISVYLLLYVSQQPALLLIITIAVLYRIKWRSDKLTISDTEIQIHNSFTSTKTILKLNEIEKYAFNAEPVIGERLLLISDNLVVAKIRYKNYSNLSELLNSMNRTMTSPQTPYRTPEDFNKQI